MSFKTKNFGVSYQMSIFDVTYFGENSEGGNGTSVRLYFDSKILDGYKYVSVF